MLSEETLSDLSSNEWDALPEVNHESARAIHVALCGCLLDSSLPPQRLASLASLIDDDTDMQLLAHLLQSASASMKLKYVVLRLLAHLSCDGRFDAHWVLLLSSVIACADDCALLLAHCQHDTLSQPFMNAIAHLMRDWDEKDLLTLSVRCCALIDLCRDIRGADADLWQSKMEECRVEGKLDDSTLLIEKQDVATMEQYLVDGDCSQSVRDSVRSTEARLRLLSYVSSALSKCSDDEAEEQREQQIEQDVGMAMDGLMSLSGRTLIVFISLSPASAATEPSLFATVMMAKLCEQCDIMSVSYGLADGEQQYNEEQSVEDGEDVYLFRHEEIVGDIPALLRWKALERSISEAEEGPHNRMSVRRGIAYALSCASEEYDRLVVIGGSSNGTVPCPTSSFSSYVHINFGELETQIAVRYHWVGNDSEDNEPEDLFFMCPPSQNESILLFLSFVLNADAAVMSILEKSEASVILDQSGGIGSEERDAIDKGEDNVGDEIAKNTDQEEAINSFFCSEEDHQETQDATNDWFSFSEREEKVIDSPSWNFEESEVSEDQECSCDRPVNGQEENERSSFGSFEGADGFDSFGEGSSATSENEHDSFGSFANNASRDDGDEADSFGEFGGFKNSPSSKEESSPEAFEWSSFEAAPELETPELHVECLDASFDLVFGDVKEEIDTECDCATSIEEYLNLTGECTHQVISQTPVYLCVLCGLVLSFRPKHKQWQRARIVRKLFSRALTQRDEEDECGVVPSPQPSPQRVRSSEDGERPVARSLLFVALVEPLPDASQFEVPVCEWGEEESSVHTFDRDFFASLPSSTSTRKFKKLPRVSRRKVREKKESEVDLPANQPAPAASTYPLAAGLRSLGKLSGVKGVKKSLSSLTGDSVRCKELLREDAPVSLDAFLVGREVSAVTDGAIVSSCSGIDGLIALDESVQQYLMGQPAE